MLIEPYKVFSLKTVLRKINIDENDNSPTNTLFEDMYSDNPDLIKFIYEYLFLNVLFVTPKFKLESGFEYINIIDKLKLEFGDDIIIYECDENTKNMIINKTIKLLSFQSLVVDLSKTPDIKNTNIIKSIDDLYNEDKVINTIIYFLQKYGHSDYDCIHVYEKDTSYTNLDEYVYNSIDGFINILRSLVSKHNFNINVDDIKSYIINNNIKLENIINISENENEIKILTNKFLLTINNDGFLFNTF